MNAVIINTLDAVRTGDLLIWSQDKSSKKSSFYLKLIRFATASEFAHVGVAIVIFNRLFVLEATMPFIRLAPVKSNDSFYYIPMYIDWKDEYYDYLFKYIGCVYGLLDAIRSYLGITLKNDARWQCAELVVDFYKKLGLDFSGKLTPSAVVKTILAKTNYPIYLIKPKKDQ